MDPSPALPVPVVQSFNAARRHLLFALGAGGAGGAATAAAPAVAAMAPAPALASESSSGGYRVSEHVRNYYQSARR
jgi:hypothetical protein